MENGEEDRGEKEEDEEEEECRRNEHGTAISHFSAEICGLTLPLALSIAHLISVRLF